MLFIILDIHQCEPNNPQHDCGTNAHCVNTDGGFTCVCDEGYMGNPQDGCTGECIYILLP